jgi:epimerase transport system membrane fusion protein
LISERDRLQSISFSQWLVEVSDERAQTAIANEKTLFKARLADRETEAAVLRQQANIYQSQAKGVEAALNSRREVAFSLEEETSDLKALLQDGYVDKQRLRQLERTLANTLGEISELEEKAAGTRVAIEEAQLRAVQLDKRFIKEVVDEITVVQEQVYDVKQRINVITDKLERTTVKTPIAGIVVEVKPNTLGAVLGPGQDLVTIVPDSDRLIVDVHLSPMDIDRLIVGQEAEVRFSVFKDAYTITGTLVKLSADSVQDEVTGETIFRGKVRLHENDINLLGDEKLVPGMPAEVMIKTGTSTFLSYITSPLARIMDNSLIED